jgi:hypothetical protein
MNNKIDYENITDFDAMNIENKKSMKNANDFIKSYLNKGHSVSDILALIHNNTGKINDKIWDENSNNKFFKNNF